MRTIQTFWPDEKLGIYQKAGWRKSRYHWMSWTLSSNLINSNNKDLTLYTNKPGQDILIGQLDLPYEHLNCKLDNLGNYPPGLWSLAKIFTYGQQETPFVHIDSDVFTTINFNESFKGADLIVQNKEIVSDNYKSIWEALTNTLEYIPKILSESNLEYSCNMGIVGGNNITLFKNYLKEAQEFVDKNKACWHNINQRDFNVAYEQILFYHLYSKNNLSYIFPEIWEDHNYQGFGDFDRFPKEYKYLHLIGNYKRDIHTCKKMEIYLMKYFPLQFKKCISILPGEEETAADLLELDHDYIVEAIRSFKLFLNDSYIFSNSKHYLIARDLHNENCPQYFDQLLISQKDIQFQLLSNYDSDLSEITIPQWNEDPVIYQLDEFDHKLLVFLSYKYARYSKVYEKMLSLIDLENPESLEVFKRLFNNRLRKYLDLKILSIRNIPAFS